jgi:hypothetical protein
MKHLEGEFKGVKDLKIYYQAWFTFMVNMIKKRNKFT